MTYAFARTRKVRRIKHKTDNYSKPEAADDPIVCYITPGRF